MIALGINYWYLIPVCIFVIGNRQHALALLGHDATHKLVSKNKYINYTLGNFLCYTPILLPWEGYRVFHMAHHRYLGTTKDPELDRKVKAHITSSKANKRHIITQFFRDLIGLDIQDAKELSISKTPNDLFWIIITHMVIISTGLFISWLIPLMWYLAMGTSLVACSRLRIWYEHVGTDSTHKIKPTWWQKLLFLPHNAAYHYEHHKHPAVPYHKLHMIGSAVRKKVSEIH